MSNGNARTAKRTRVEIFDGITVDARALGVSRVHLWLVLKGKRTSPKLLQRYRDLKAAQAANGDHENQSSCAAKNEK